MPTDTEYQQFLKHFDCRDSFKTTTTPLINLMACQRT